MDVNIGRKDRIIRDVDIKKKFEDFNNGFFDDISMELYEADGKYFLNLAPYTNKILSSNMCITASSKSELESIIEDLSCNIGIMLAEKSGKIQKAETNNQTVQIDGKEVSLLNFEQVHIAGKNGDTELYRADELTEKIKSISSKVFGSEKDFDMSSYIKNIMFTRMNGKHTLEKKDFELLKYYKEEGYEFLNSFLGDGKLKTRGNIEKEHIGKEFINNLYKIDELFEKFPTLDASITVYRGATTENLSNNIEYDSFVSTSLDRSVAEKNFSKGRLYQINLSKGTHYIPMDAINGFEGMYGESEAEILLRPSSFDVINKEFEGDTEVLKVNAKEKGNFSEIIRKSLETRKEELIKKGLCDEKEFKEVLDYLNEKYKEESAGQPGYSIEENEKKVIEKQQQVLMDYTGKQIGNRTIEEQFEKQTGKRTITTNGELINEDGKYKFSEVSEGIGTDLEKQRKEMIIDNKITGENEQHVCEKDKNGKEMYYKLVDGKLTFKITKNNRGTTIENFYKGQIKDVFEYDEEGKPLIGMGEIEHIDENYVENFFDSQVPYFEAENREIINNKSTVNTQKLGKETFNEMSDTVLMDETERDINQQEKNLYIEKQNQEL